MVARLEGACKAIGASSARERWPGGGLTDLGRARASRRGIDATPARAELLSTVVAYEIGGAVAARQQQRDHAEIRCAPAGRQVIADGCGESLDTSERVVADRDVVRQRGQCPDAAEEVEPRVEEPERTICDLIGDRDDPGPLRRT